MIDYHARQMTGTACASYNCAAASTAMAIHAGTGGKVTLTADTVRSLSKASCVPGVHSGSGGLYISDVIRVCGLYSVAIDYGRDPVAYYRRWTESDARTRLAGGYGAVFLGDYDQLVAPWRTNTAFAGDHSVWAHDLRADGTVCWHDPLRLGPIRVPMTVLLRYWQKPTSPIRGYAGWVKDTRTAGLPDTGTEDEMYEAKFERWLLDGGPGKVTTFGTPIGPDGKPQYTLWRLALTSGTGDTNRRLRLIARSRLTEHTDRENEALYRALASYAMPTGDCTAAIAADRAKARVTWEG